MAKNILVTLADKNYLKQAKQLFSSAYFNAAWKGDMMLLTNDISNEEALWFIKRNILIKRYESLCDYPIGYLKKSSVLTGKFFLFQEYFKNWERVIFLDSDIIVRSPIDFLLKIKGFGAVKDVDSHPLRLQFTKEEFLDAKGRELLRELESKYFLEKPSFNSGVMVFTTDIINRDSFDKIKSIFEKYHVIHQVGDQPTLNLYFYNKWEKMPIVFNIYASRIGISYGKIKPKRLNGIIMHIFGRGDDKPWSENNPFYNEWVSSFKKADNIFFEGVERGAPRWSVFKIYFYSFYLTARGFISRKYNFLKKFVKNATSFYSL